MLFSDLFPSRFVKSEDLIGRRVTKTIKSYRREEMEGQTGEKKTKVIISFSDSAKEWVCPVTCGYSLKAMFGDDANKWIGKRVTLFAKEGAGFGGDGPAVRVFGSPDIAKPIKQTIKRGRKNIVIDVVPTKAEDTQANIEEPGSAG